MTLGRILNRLEFLACLDDKPSLGLEVFAQAKRHLPAAVEELRFDGFGGHDYEVMSRFYEQLVGRTSESALWALVAVDLWFCNNFGGDHWRALIERDPSNIRFAVQAAYWVFAVSGKDCGGVLADLISLGRCWSEADEFMRADHDQHLRSWWRYSVLSCR